MRRWHMEIVQEMTDNEPIKSKNSLQRAGQAVQSSSSPSSYYHYLQGLSLYTKQVVKSPY